MRLDPSYPVTVLILYAETQEYDGRGRDSCLLDLVFAADVGFSGGQSILSRDRVGMLDLLCHLPA